MTGERGGGEREGKGGKRGGEGREKKRGTKKEQLEAGGPRGLAP